MRSSRFVFKGVLSAAAVLSAALAVSSWTRPAAAATVAHLPFEEGPDGGFLAAVNGGDPHTTTADVSGNGNSFRTFNSPANANQNFDTSPRYTTERPNTAVPGTGAANNFAFNFDGSDDVYPDSGTGSLMTTDFNDFTIEAYYRPDVVTGNRTIVGRDDTGNPGLLAGGRALLYLQTRGTSVAFEAADANGAYNTAIVSPAGTLAVGTWYHIAVVGDSATDTATLYVNGVSVGATPAGSFVDGLYDPTPDTIWTVGRGQFNGGVVDFVDGQIDEVRWSDAALSPSQFLNAAPIPEPAAAGVIALAALAVSSRRRRRAL